MNDVEKRIIHGLYFHREMIGEEMIYWPAELNWLARAPLPTGREWQGKDGKLQSAPIDGDDWLQQHGAMRASAKRPLGYLKEAGLISYTQESGMLRISVTHAGADVARELDTRFGRFNFWFKAHKGGVLFWIVSTIVAISFLIVRFA